MSIQTIIAETFFEGMNRQDKVWDVISHIEEHSQKLANVLDLYSLKTMATEKHLSWNAMLDDAPFSWIEKNIFDSQNKVLQFESLSGDFDIWRGKWKVGLNSKNAVSLKIKLEYELGIPVLEENISDILQTKVHGYLKLLLLSIGRIVENKQRDERVNPRYYLDAFHNATLNGLNSPISIVDISRGGARIKISSAVGKYTESITIGQTEHEVGEFIPEHGNFGRIIFAHELSDESLSSILDEAEYIRANSN